MPLNIFGTDSLADLAGGDEDYWAKVYRTLTYVFEVEKLDAEAQVRDFRRSIGARPLPEQVLFRHTDPFDVARRIVRGDDEPPRESDVQRYQEMLGH